MLRTRTSALLLFFVALSPAARAAPPGLPASIKGDYAFNEIGKALAQNKDFPRNGSDLDKTRYIFNQLPAIANRYNLRTAGGGTDNPGVGWARLWGSDPENADALKKKGYGNCGEWSWAFHEILNGANVTSQVIYADKSKGFTSLGHGGTDTALIVEQRRGREISRRVFDAYRAGFDSRTGKPTSSTLDYWADRPLSDEDKWPSEAGKSSWQKDQYINKPYLKDGITRSLLEPVAPQSRIKQHGPAAPAAPATPVAPQPTVDLSGQWKCGCGTTWTLSKAGQGSSGTVTYAASLRNGNWSASLAGPFNPKAGTLTLAGRDSNGNEVVITLTYAPGRGTMSGTYMDKTKGKSNGEQLWRG